MTAIRTFASHLFAGATALAISLVMISGTVSNPAAPTAATTEILA